MRETKTGDSSLADIAATQSVSSGSRCRMFHQQTRSSQFHPDWSAMFGGNPVQVDDQKRFFRVGRQVPPLDCEIEHRAACFQDELDPLVQERSLF